MATMNILKGSEYFPCQSFPVFVLRQVASLCLRHDGMIIFDSQALALIK